MPGKKQEERVCWVSYEQIQRFICIKQGYYMKLTQPRGVCSGSSPHHKLQPSLMPYLVFLGRLVYRKYCIQYLIMVIRIATKYKFRAQKQLVPPCRRLTHFLSKEIKSSIKRLGYCSRANELNVSFNTFSTAKVRTDSGFQPPVLKQPSKTKVHISLISGQTYCFVT